MNKNLRELLEQWLNIAHKAISNKLYDEVKLAKNQFLETTDVSDMMKEVNKKKDKIKILETEIDILQKDIEIQDRSLTHKEIEESGLRWYSNRYSDYIAWKNTQNSVNRKNLVQFEYISDKFNQKFNMAIWAKEQRNVLWEFYMLDWLWLWIEVPIDAMTSDISIENWVINVQRKQLAETNS